MQKVVDEARAKGARVVVLLSHNGMDVDLKLASRVTGIDAILGGHTHDAVPQPTVVANRSGKTLVTNAGSNGKFLAVLDLDVTAARSPISATGCCRCSATCCRPIPAWPRTSRACASPTPRSSTRSSRPPKALLYRRGNFNGTFDQLILRCADGGEERADRVLAGLPLGHVAAARAGDHDGAPDGPDRDHVSVRDRQRA